ncbi:MAG: 1-acyl-sn-glycerol-3-phosphate acyltransferase [Bacteroidales bacterium]|nr:1-acyl-sn-glycerol-3-phosphate acyltransferase [Bacteroidales bacterium]
MGKIYEANSVYSILRYYVDWCTKRSFRRVEVKGTENIPQDGAVIIAPNHCNTLMDALVILRTEKDEIVFGARADLFNNKFIGKIMTFLRILPMMRQRDGLRNVLKNNETSEIIVETLENGVPFCIFPEGTHRTMHSLRALGKGVFRIAIAADKKFGGVKPVYIIPTGIEYGDYFRTRSTSLVTFGKPINVTEYLKNAGDDNEQHLIEGLRTELKARMPENISYIEDDSRYPQMWELTKMLTQASGKGYGECGRSLHEAMLDNKKIIKDLTVRLEQDTEKMESLLDEVKEFERDRRKNKISIYSFGRKNPSTRVCGKAVKGLLLLPYFLFSAIISLPMWATAEAIRSKVRDKAFRNTVNFGVNLAMGGLLYPVLVILLFCFTPWIAALSISLLAIPAYGFFYDYVEGCRRWISDIRLLGNSRLSERFKKIVNNFR